MFFKIVSVEAGFINVWVRLGGVYTDKKPFFEVLSVWMEKNEQKNTDKNKIFAFLSVSDVFFYQRVIVSGAAVKELKTAVAFLK